MLRIKLRNSALAHKKFAAFRRWFAIAAGIALICAVLTAFLFPAASHALPGRAPFRQAFLPLFTRACVLYLIVLLTGVTIYAPAALILTALTQGFAAGYILSGLLPPAGGRGLFTLLLTALYLTFSALWFFAYASFCVCVSRKIFSSHAERGAAGEEHLFSGSLFYTEFFCGTVNLRSLFSYLLFFFAALAGQTLLTALFALARAYAF